MCIAVKCLEINHKHLIKNIQTYSSIVFFSNISQPHIIKDIQMCLSTVSCKSSQVLIQNLLLCSGTVSYNNSHAPISKFSDILR